MYNTIKEYLTTESGLTPDVAKRLDAKLAKHPDLYGECLIALEENAYPAVQVSVAGYTAEDISKLASFMTIVGTYGFLVYLRENPDDAKQQISLGFPRK